MLPTISAAESVFQKCLVVVLLTDCPLIKDVDGRLVITMT